MEKNNIEYEKRTPYAHHHLRPVKRPILIIANEIRTLLIDTHLPEELEVELIKTIVYLRNRSSTRILDQLIPYKYHYKKKPDVFYLRIINLVVYYHKIKSELGLNRKIKLELKARKCRLIEYEK